MPARGNPENQDTKVAHRYQPAQENGCQCKQDDPLRVPVPVPGGDRLVCIDNHSLAQVDSGGPLSYPDFQDYRAQASSFEWFEAINDEGGILTESGIPPHRYHVARATAGVFAMVHTKALLGRAFLPADDHAGAQPVVVLSYNVWQEGHAEP